MRLYGELAPWFHLLTHPDEYAEEAAHILALARAACRRPPRTLLELGAGGGNNASHLKRDLVCTLTDLSPDMLAVSQGLNPDCEHIEGDMRTLRLARRFDVVLAHDALAYLLSEADLAAAIATAAHHLAPGGAAILLPDAVSESFAPATSHGGHDGPDGRSLRYLEWTHALEPGARSAEVDFALLLREPGKPTRLEQDRHRIGLFPREAWRRLIEAAGLERVTPEVDDPHAGQHEVFVARKPG